LLHSNDKDTLGFVNLVRNWNTIGTRLRRNIDVPANDSRVQFIGRASDTPSIEYAHTSVYRDWEIRKAPLTLPEFDRVSKRSLQLVSITTPRRRFDKFKFKFTFLFRGKCLSLIFLLQNRARIPLFLSRAISSGFKRNVIHREEIHKKEKR